MMNLHEIIDYESKKRVEMLKNRTKRCVCKYCGGKLKLKRIIFSQHEEGRIEIFCDHCDVNSSHSSHSDPHQQVHNYFFKML